MSSQRRTFWCIVILLLAIVLSVYGPTHVYGSSHASSVAPKATPTMGMGMGHSGKPNMKAPEHQVAPAVSAMLMPLAKACGSKVTGSGSVKMIPVHVGRMSGPHVHLVVNLHGAVPMHQYSIYGSFAGKPPVKWSGTAEVDTTGMHGGMYVNTRLMPMVRAGRYTARIQLRDMACGGMMGHPPAYQTPNASIELK